MILNTTRQNKIIKSLQLFRQAAHQVVTEMKIKNENIKPMHCRTADDTMVTITTHANTRQILTSSYLTNEVSTRW